VPSILLLPFLFTRFARAHGNRDIAHRHRPPLPVSRSRRHCNDDAQERVPPRRPPRLFCSAACAAPRAPLRRRRHRAHGRVLLPLPPAAARVLLVPATATIVALQHAAVVVVRGVPAAAGGLHSQLRASQLQRRRGRWTFRRRVRRGAAAAQPHPAVVPMVLQVPAAVVVRGPVG
jgi:hypothetical protein